MLTSILRNTDKWIVSFVTIVFTSLFWPILPPVALMPITFLIACFILRFFSQFHLSGALFGILWMASVGHWYLNWQLPTQHIAQISQIRGSVVSLVREHQGIKFNFNITHVDGHAANSQPLVRLSWLTPPWPVKQGQEVNLWVKLKPIHGLANEGGFDYQTWLLSNRIVATGYVKNHSDNHLIADSITLRQTLLDRLHAMDLKHEAWIAALSLGDRSLFTDQDWTFIQQTGLAHLVAISGMHLGIIATITYAFFSLLSLIVGRILRLSQAINLHYPILGLVSLVTLGYAYLAGFSLPTIRAWCMLGIVLILIFCRRHWSWLHILIYCAFTLVLVIPLSILSGSFWLSFFAVAFVFWGLWRWPVNAKANGTGIQKLSLAFKSMVILQLALTLLMIPIVAYQFGMVSVVAILCNLIAIPLVTFILLPLCMLATCLLILDLSASEWVFMLLNQLIDLCLQFQVQERTTLPLVWQLPFIPMFPWILCGLAGLLVLFPPLPIRKMWLLLLIIPMTTYFFPQYSKQWQLHVMDVGQGLSVVVMRNQRALVYDTGASYPSGFNMADAVIKPFLQAKSIDSLDWIIISHFDNDHAGGLAQLKHHFPEANLISTKAQCKQGWQMTWQGLTFESLWPQTLADKSYNDSSCVIRITDGNHVAILPGDISRKVEQVLVADYADKIHADILVAPHHGSNTSSSEAFIQSVAPRYVVFSQGYLNRWNFPAQSVVNRYARRGTLMYATAQDGQVSFTLDPESKITLSIATYRKHKFVRWYSK